MCVNPPPSKYLEPVRGSCEIVSNVVGSEYTDMVMEVLFMTDSELRVRIVQHLESLGYRLEGGVLRLPSDSGDAKALIRRIQLRACDAMISRAKTDLFYREPEILGRFINGDVVVPEKISPRLVLVEPESVEADIIRYVRLTTAVPSEAQRGRSVRYVVEDAYTGGVMGVVVIGSPVLHQGDRDEWVGWDSSSRVARMKHVAEAWGLVSIPPYSQLMSGKLMALIGVCSEVRELFESRYGDPLALMTTSSAFGRSSVYNRLKYRSEMTFIRVGWTKGYGNFHFNDDAILEAVRQFCRREDPSRTFLNKMAMLSYALPKLGLSPSLLQHGIRREMFVMPTARNTREFLTGGADVLDYIDRPFEDVVAWWKERWMLKRASWDDRYKSARGSDIRLWSADEAQHALRGTQTRLF